MENQQNIGQLFSKLWRKPKSKDGKIFKMLPDGEERIVKDAEFGSRTTEKKQFELRAD